MVFYQTNTQRECSTLKGITILLKRKIEEKERNDHSIQVRTDLVFDNKKISHRSARTIQERQAYAAQKLDLEKQVLLQKLESLSEAETHSEHIDLVTRFKQRKLSHEENDFDYNKNTRGKQYYSTKPKNIVQLNDHDLKILQQTGQLGFENDSLAIQDTHDFDNRKFHYELTQSDEKESSSNTTENLISAFESLPREILEIIFLYSHNFEVPLVSKTLFHKLSSIHSFSKPSDVSNTGSTSNPFDGRSLHISMLSHLSVPLPHYKPIKPEDMQTFKYFYKNNTVPIKKPHRLLNKTNNDGYLNSKKTIPISTAQLHRVRRLARLRATNVNILKRRFVTAETLKMAGIKYFIEFSTPLTMRDESSLFDQDKISTISQFFFQTSQNLFSSSSQSSTRFQSPSLAIKSELTPYLMNPVQKSTRILFKDNSKRRKHTLTESQSVWLKKYDSCVEISKLNSSFAQILPYCVLPIPAYLLATTLIPDRQHEATDFKSTLHRNDKPGSVISKRKLDIIIYLLSFKSYSIPFICAVTPLGIKDIKHILNINELEQKIKSRKSQNDTNNDSTPSNQQTPDTNDDASNNENNDRDMNLNHTEADPENIDDGSENQEELENIKVGHEKMCAAFLDSAIRRIDIEAIDKLFNLQVTVVPKRKRQRNLEEMENNVSSHSDLPTKSGHFFIDLNWSLENDISTEENENDGEDEEDEEPEKTSHHLISVSSSSLLLALQILPPYDTDNFDCINQILAMTSETSKSRDEIWEWLLSSSEISSAISIAEKTKIPGKRTGNLSIAEKYHSLADLVLKAGGCPSLHAISSQTR